MSIINYLRYKLKQVELKVIGLSFLWVAWWVWPPFILNEDLASWWVILYPCASLITLLLYADFKQWQKSIFPNEVRRPE